MPPATASPTAGRTPGPPPRPTTTAATSRTAWRRWAARAGSRCSEGPAGHRRRRGLCPVRRVRHGGAVAAGGPEPPGRHDDRLDVRPPRGQLAELRVRVLLRLCVLAISRRR